MVSLLRVDRLSKSFDGRPAVKEISFAVAAGDIVGLLGPNGAGKSTTIRTIMGIYQPDSGTIEYGDGLTGPDMIGYLPEERGLYPDATVLDCLVYLAALKGVPRREATARAQEWLRRVELEACANRKVETLSKGMQQKVQFIAAVIHRPKLAILDEVFSGLDPVNQELVMELIKELSAAGTTMLVSAHQINLVESLCRRIVLVEGGETILAGEVEQVKRSHGVRLAHLSYQGDASFLRSLPGVTIERWEAGEAGAAGEAVLRLDESLSPDAFLREIVGRISINHLSITWPPLHDIFVDAVKARRGVA